VPVARNRELFYSLVERGEKLVDLHLMESSEFEERITTLVGSGEFQVEKVSYSDKTVWVDKAKTCGFRGVTEEVWSFQIGCYQVCEKWLKDRRA